MIPSTHRDTSDHACAIVSRWQDSRGQTPPAEVALSQARCACADLGAIGLDRATVAADQAAGAATAGSRPLPDMRIFGAEFFEYCADRRSTPEAFAKVQAFGAKLLAMQRAPL
jgi:hypothetical protein